jgi:hypothetical protein
MVEGLIVAGRRLRLLPGEVDCDQCPSSIESRRVNRAGLALPDVDRLLAYYRNKGVSAAAVPLKSTIRRLLAVLMIAGLALAPVSRPVMAAASSHVSEQAMPDQMASPEMPAIAMADEMASDMPCCPSKAPVDCDKCVFMAACASICFAGASATVSHPLPIVSRTIALQRNDSWPDGFGHPPPEHPPRTLV